MKESKITINGILAPGVSLEITGERGDGLMLWRVAGTVDGLAPLHVGDEYLIRATWRENRRLSLSRGRLAIYLEPRDVWVGVYVAGRHLYVCLLPCVVLRWTRQWWWRRMEEA